MPDETPPPENEEFAVVLPPNSRLSGLHFDDTAHALHVSFSDGGSDRDVPIEKIVAFHGARIRHEKLVRSPKKIASQAMSLGSVSGAGPGSLSSVTGEIVSTGEDLHFALALRVAGVGELWYLVANSFNFRKALGQEAGYSTEINFRALVRRLSAFAPRATQDGFFAALLGGLPLPPPVGSLIEFFKTAGKDLR